MLTLERLIEYGADTVKGLERCMNNEAFYFRLIGMAAADGNFDKLRQAIADGDLDNAFEAAHALKGITGNLSLDPLFDPICEITELLRAKTEMDYSENLKVIFDKLQELKDMIG